MAGAAGPGIPAKAKQEAMAFAPQRPAWLERRRRRPCRSGASPSAVPEPPEGALRGRVAARPPPPISLPSADG